MSKWINLKDKLPPINKYVLTYNPDVMKMHSVVIKFVTTNDPKKIFNSKSRFYKITHWMPLPEIPGKI